MPRQKLPSSLYRICLTYVTSNMQVLYPEHTSIVGGLPPNINEEIFTVLQRSQPNNLALLLKILSSVLRSIRLPPGTKLIAHAAPDVFSQLPRNKEHLTELHLVLTEQHVGTFAELLSQLVRLQRLVLWLDDLTEPLVDAISRYCTGLRQLCLYKVGRGSYIRVLAANDNGHLVELSVHFPVKILTSLPELRVFRISFLAFALLSLPATVRLGLTELVALEPSIFDCTWALPHIIAVCPMLTRVYLSLANDRDITPLSCLAFLDDLSLFTNGDGDIGFMDLVEPLLCRIGSNLRRLRLYISDLDINCIIRYCTALHELRLEGLERLINYSRCETRGLGRLRKFRLSFHVMSSVHPNRPFEFLQDYGRLTEVSLRRCHLADEALRQLISSGTLSRLGELQLTEVHGVTVAGLKDLVVAHNDLVLLFIIRCPHVTTEHVDELRRLVQSMNLGLRIHFTPPSDQWA
ncbi:unnamed protein product [Ixodes hexagonus]